MFIVAYRAMVVFFHRITVLVGQPVGWPGWYPAHNEKNYWFYSDGTYATLAEEDAEIQRLKKE